MSEEFEANSCRICLTKTKKLRSLYIPIDEDEEPPNEMLRRITGIQVEKINEHIMLPKNICKNCELSLSMAFEFRVNALKTQLLIVSYLKGLKDSEVPKETIKATTKSHLKCKKENDFEMDIQPIDTVVLDDEETNTLEEGADTESVVELIDNQEFNEQNKKYVLEDNEENESYNEDNENYTDHQQFNDDYRTEVEERINDKDELEEKDGERVKMKVEDGQVIKVEDSKVVNKTNDLKSSKKSCNKVSKSFLNIEKQEHEELPIQQDEEFVIPRRGRKPINSTTNFNHICDVCGNIFTKRSRMMEHRQRHDKELKYTCELCDQKFHMRELLRKHMYSHSGGKPYKCEFCSRTFYYESVKKAHEAVHQGHKPYVCDVCGKAFGYAHALKKHTLIHAEIKLYRCEYCNKDFRLQHHMKQHQLTKMHQNAVRVAGVNQCYNYVDDGDDGDIDANDVIEDEHELTDDILVVEEISEHQLVTGI